MEINYSFKFPSSVAVENVKALAAELQSKLLPEMACWRSQWLKKSTSMVFSHGINAV